VPASANKVIRVEMDKGQLDDIKLKALVTAILQTAPNASIFGSSPLLQACVASLQKASDAYDAAGTAVTADEAKLATDKQTWIDARGVLVTTVVQYRGLVETSAINPSDVIALGLPALNRTVSPSVTTPTGIDILYPKKGHGRAKVTVQYANRSDRHDCQICLDPQAQNTWTDVDGDGRSHWLTTYKSGTVLWVRFRAVRGHEKSDWCNPVPVTIP
jgi:hypothetical protein